MPDKASTLCPNAINIPTRPMVFIQSICSAQPSDSGEKLSSAGGICAPRRPMVINDQMASRKQTASENAIILALLELDSSIPFTFCRQKYTVTNSPNTTEMPPSGRVKLSPAISKNELASPHK